MPGSLDTNFNAVVTTAQVGFSVAVQFDGKVIAVGTFGVMRFLDDGSVDPTFQSIPPGPAPLTGPGQGLGAVVLQPDGRILVTGSFTNSAGVPLPGIMRLNTDGSIDPSFNLDRAYPGGRVLALQPDGKVVGGLFRLRPDGSTDPDFDAGWYNSSAEFYSLGLAPDGRIYFGTSEGIGRVKSDGSFDDSFAPEPGLGPWGAIVVQPDGRVLVGQYGDGPGYGQMRRLLVNGADDPDWSRPSFNGGDAVVLAILLQPDGKVLVGGENLEAFNGSFNANLGRLNSDGSVDGSFDTGGALHYYSVGDMALAPDGKVVVAGRQLNRPDITPAPGIWRLNNDAGPRGIEFTAPSYVAHEGDGWINIPVRRTTGTDQLAMVTCAARPGTATRGRDYFGGNGVVVFHPGETLKRIRIHVGRDHEAEGFETVRLELVRARGGSIGLQRAATLTIVDP